MNSNTSQKLCYQGHSLEEFLHIKNQFQERSIPFSESQKKQEHWYDFIFLLFVGTGSAGTRKERDFEYSLYVREDDFERARDLITDILKDRS